MAGDRRCAAHSLREARRDGRHAAAKLAAILSGYRVLSTRKKPPSRYGRNIAHRVAADGARTLPPSISVSRYAPFNITIDCQISPDSGGYAAHRECVAGSLLHRKLYARQPVTPR
ncbi:hypothetical protein [Paraburkholderia diazotrophica]|uniref:hypothetical protein n=1 Tax=Paraburkholderia diazotrophica TaxID=667676 RepID=UPI003171A77D